MMIATWRGHAARKPSVTLWTPLLLVLGTHGLVKATEKSELSYPSTGVSWGVLALTLPSSAPTQAFLPPLAPIELAPELSVLGVVNQEPATPLIVDPVNARTFDKNKRLGVDHEVDPLGDLNQVVVRLALVEGHPVIEPIAPLAIQIQPQAEPAQARGFLQHRSRGFKSLVGKCNHPSPFRDSCASQTLQEC